MLQEENGLSLTFWVGPDHQSQDVRSGNQRENMAVFLALLAPECQIIGIKS